MKISISTAWYDFRVGFFWDTKKKVLYSSNGLCPYCSNKTIEFDLEHGKDSRVHANLDKIPKTKVTIKW